MLSLTIDLPTPYHRWRAGAKLGALCASTMILYAISQIELQLIALGGVAVLYAVPSWSFFKLGVQVVRRLWLMIALIFAYHLIWGDPYVGAVIVLRLTSAIALASLVTLTTALRDIQAVLDWLMKPLARLGLRTSAVSLAIALMIRFVPHILLMWDRLSDSWRLRSARRPSWRIVFPIVLGVLEDADHVSDALRARGGI